MRVWRRNANSPTTVTMTIVTMKTRYQVMKNRVGVIGCASMSGRPIGRPFGPQI